MTLRGIICRIFGVDADVSQYPIVVLADDGTGRPVPLTLSGGKLPVSSTLGTGGAETPSATRATSSGSVAAGANSVVLITSQAVPAIGNGVDFSGTILGVSRGPGEIIPISAQPGNTLGAIAYTIAGGSSIDILKTVPA